ncbi:serine/threonine-protein kinase [Parafrankia sp. BMG5.11]|uniref:serine/threonine-protein kinase n=1 Tax=Parafrankia sp. BMG5.11 TaxID=222540 RepID=UPI000DA5C130|nr:serine/threonine-protein kinase [Parafrankia sp. BMG5.11]SQD96222.1 Serine/threonine protein kinase [Parafrankia sp. Ea1.12]
MSEPTGVACVRPGCVGGVIMTSGFCNRCGAPGPEPASETETESGPAPAAVVVPAQAAPPEREAVPDQAATPEQEAEQPTEQGAEQAPEQGAEQAPDTADPVLVTTQPISVSRPAAKDRDPLRLPVRRDVVVANRPVLLSSPNVPTNLRECAACGTRVARPGPEGAVELEGVCPRCRQPYSFTVKLAAGDHVGQQYTVHGAIGHGGMGWVYAATNDNLGDDDIQAWVVLKGLLDVANPEARRIAEVERRMLISVNHPNIVKIRDYVSHQGEDYIVMEYVPGVSLSRLAETQPPGPDGRPRPLPPADAIRYLLRLLPALSHLHRRGLAYCDLKPDNIMVSTEQVTLIDLGGARRLDDQFSSFLSTPGYRAPELEEGEFRPAEVTRHSVPTVASDVFAAARTLARLVLGRFPGFLDVHRHGLPPRGEHAPLLEFESLDHLLRRGTASDPADRFATVAEFAEELTGVLYEIASRTEGNVPPLASRWFEPDLHPTGEADDGHGEADEPPTVWEILPDLRIDADDPQARVLATTPGEDPAALADRLAEVAQPTRQTRLALARAQMRAGYTDKAEVTVRELAAAYPREWRVTWCQGLLDLAAGRSTQAAEAFEKVYARMPGELAPRLAVATASADAGDRARAAELFDVVSQVDPAITSAAFGLARCLDDRDGKLDAYRRVPASTHAYTAARVRMIGVLVGSHLRPEQAGAVPVVVSLDDLRSAEAILESSRPRLGLDRRRRAELRLDILAAALRMVGAGPPGPTRTGPKQVFGRRLVPRELRLGLEAAYRDIARLAGDRRERIRYVDAANRIRPRTLW